MNPIDYKQPVNFLLWTLAVLAFGIVARLGWEIGGKVWSLF